MAGRATWNPVSEIFRKFAADFDPPTPEIADMT